MVPFRGRREECCPEYSCRKSGLATGSHRVNAEKERPHGLDVATGSGESEPQRPGENEKKLAHGVLIPCALFRKGNAC